jgi:hypothetical protein
VNDPDTYCSVFTKAPRGIKFGCGDYHSYNDYTFYAAASDVFQEQSRGHIKVSVSSIDQPAFKRNWFARSLATSPNDKGATVLWPKNPYNNIHKGWWTSPNEAIQKGLYQSTVMGRWNSHYLIGLYCANMDGDNKPVSGFSEEYGVQGFWMVPESMFDAVATPVKYRCSRVIDFSLVKKFSQFKDTATVSFISNVKDFQSKEYYPIVMSGGGSVMAIDPAMEIRNMNLVINVTRLKYHKQFNFRFEAGDENAPNVLFDSKQHEIGTPNNSAADATLHIPLPDGTKRIRLINDSPKDCRLVIRKLLFMDK